MISGERSRSRPEISNRLNAFDFLRFLAALRENVLRLCATLWLRVKSETVDSKS